MRVYKVCLIKNITLMKTKLMMLFAVLFLTSTGLTAQNRQQATPEERAKRQVETLTKELTLNEEQQKQVYDISLKFSKQRTSQMGSDASREKRREEFQKIQKQQDEEIKAILTEDQKKKYDEHQKEAQNRTRENRRQR